MNEIRREIRKYNMRSRRSRRSIKEKEKKEKKKRKIKDEENEELILLRDRIENLEKELSEYKEKYLKKREKIKKLKIEFENMKNLSESRQLFKYDTIEGILSDFELLPKLIKLNREQFYFIFNICSDQLSKTTSKGEERTIKKRKTKYSEKDELFITIFWMKHYVTNGLLEFIFNLKKTHLFRIISKNINILFESLQGKFIKWPNDEKFDYLMEKFYSFTYGPFKNHLCLVYGT